MFAAGFISDCPGPFPALPRSQEAQPRSSLPSPLSRQPLGSEPRIPARETCFPVSPAAEREVSRASRVARRPRGGNINPAKELPGHTQPGSGARARRLGPRGGGGRAGPLARREALGAERPYLTAPRRAVPLPRSPAAEDGASSHPSAAGRPRPGPSAPLPARSGPAAASATKPRADGGRGARARHPRERAAAGPRPGGGARRWNRGPGVAPPCGRERRRGGAGRGAVARRCVVGVSRARPVPAQPLVVSFSGYKRWGAAQDRRNSLLRDAVTTHGETDPARDIDGKTGVVLMYWFGKRPYGNRIKPVSALGNVHSGKVALIGGGGRSGGWKIREMWHM